MFHHDVAHRLSRRQVDLLVDHVDGMAFVERAVRTDERGSSRIALVRLRLLRYVGGSVRSRPTHTELTEDGRMVLCIVLGEYADALIRIGHHVGGRSAMSAVAVMVSGDALVNPLREVTEAKNLREAAQL